MVKKDDMNDVGEEKKDVRPSRRVMQVVEVEDEDEMRKKPMEEPVIQTEQKEEAVAVAQEEPPTLSREPLREEPKEEALEPVKITPGEKHDIVSELFQTNEKTTTYPDVTLGRKKNSPISLFLWVAVILIVAALIGGGLIFIKQGSTGTPKPMTVDTTVTPTPMLPLETPTPESTVSGTPTPKKGILNIQVLNGSGKSGAATAMKKLLEEKGYAVVGTGNAKTFDYEKTEIIIKADKESALSALETALSGSYSVGSTSATLSKTSTYDAQVIIGKE